LITAENVNGLECLYLKVFQRIYPAHAVMERDLIFNKKIKAGSCIAAFAW
jgi:hypothetical protein